jgi:hypothetical protein
MVKLLDAFAFSIYRSYKRLNNVAPWLVYQGPVDNAATTTALFPALLFFSISILLKVWDGHNTVAQYLTVLFIMLFFYFTASWIEKRIIRHQSVKQNKLRITGIIMVNLVIVSVLFFSFYSLTFLL